MGRIIPPNTGTYQTVPPIIGPNPEGKSGFDLQLLGKSDSYPWPGYSSQGLVELYHDGTAGNLFHLTSGPTASPTDAPALIALGVDNNRTGLYVHNRVDYGGGVGIKITQENGQDSALNHGLRVNQADDLAPAAWFGAGAATFAPVVQIAANVVPNAGQKLVRWMTTVTTASDTEMGYIDPEAKTFVWNTSIYALQAFRARSSTVVPKLQLINDAQTSGSRWIEVSSNGGFVVSQKGDSGTGGADILVITASNGNVTLKAGATLAADTTTGLKVGAAASKLGFFNATPIVKPTGVTVDAAGIHAALVSLGLIAA